MKKIVIEAIADDIRQTKQASSARFIVDEQSSAEPNGKSVRLATTVITAMFHNNEKVSGMKPGQKYRITIEEMK